jgi:hypothetical protein
MGLVALPQSGEKVSDILRADVLDLGPPGRGQRSGVTLQVTPVRLERVLGEPALHGQVVEIPPDRSGEGGQLSTSASVTAGSPWASATGAQVMLPS